MRRTRRAVKEPQRSDGPAAPDENGTHTFRRSSHHITWTFIDQALSSTTNFATGLIAGRLLGPSRFGSIAVALSAAFLTIAAQRALVSEPALAHLPLLKGDVARRAERDALMTASVIGVIAGFLCVLLGSTSVALTQDLVWVGIWMPVIVVQDAVRYVALAQSRAWVAAMSDGAWAVAQGVILLFLIVMGRGRAVSLIAAWGLGGLAGAIAGCLILRLSPWHGRPRRWLKVSRDLSWWLLPQTALSQGTSQLTTLSVGVLLGAEALGGLRATQTIMMPIGALITSAVVLLVPRMAISFNRPKMPLVWTAPAIAVAGGLLTAVPAGLLLASSTTLIRFSFGGDFVHYRHLLPPMALSMVIQAIGLPAGAGLRALHDGRAVFLAQLATSAAGLPIAVVLAATLGLAGAAWALAVQTAIMSSTAWVLYWRQVGVRRKEVYETDAAVNPYSVI